MNCPYCKGVATLMDGRRSWLKCESCGACGTRHNLYCTTPEDRYIWSKTGEGPSVPPNEQEVTND